jgi:hypothetical protein
LTAIEFLNHLLLGLLLVVLTHLILYCECQLRILHLFFPILLRPLTPYHHLVFVKVNRLIFIIFLGMTAQNTVSHWTLGLWELKIKLGKLLSNLKIQAIKMVMWVTTSMSAVKIQLLFVSRIFNAHR